MERLRETAGGLDIIAVRYRLRAEKNYKEKINPLCLEHILKSNIDDEFWHGGIFAYMLYATPDKADIDSAISLVTSTNDEKIKDVMMTYLRYMPHKIILPKLDNLIQELNVYIEQKAKQQDTLLDIKYAIEDGIDNQ